MKSFDEKMKRKIAFIMKNCFRWRKEFDESTDIRGKLTDF
jgi:hypothetical protein